MPAVTAVAHERLRRRRVATFVLVIVAAFTTAAPTAVWAAGRRTAHTVDRFLAYAHAADVALFTCPPGYDVDAEGDPTPCFRHDAADELEVVESMPEVESASRYGFTNLVGGPTPDPSSWRPLPMVALFDPVPAPTPLGQPIVLEGRLSRIDAPDELMISESSAEALGVGPGERLWLESPASESGEPFVARVAGVVRTAADVLPLAEETAGGLAPLMARAGFYRDRVDDLPWFRSIATWLDGDPGAFIEDVEQRLDDQYVIGDVVVPETERRTVQQATDFESRAATAVAALAALAGAFFVGQAISRQSRSEAVDVAVLRAIGFTHCQLLAATAMRWAPVAAAAAVLAVGLSVGASALGPIGVARRGPWDRSIRFDWTTLAVGAFATIVVVLGAAVLASMRRARDTDPTAVVSAVGSPALRTGLGLARRSLVRQGALPVLSALAATALAVGLVITATGMAATLRLVLDEPARFGAPWDAHVGDTDPETTRALATMDGVESAAFIAGTNVGIADATQVWIQALVPVEGVERSPYVIAEGRVPASDDEIALGSIPMRDAGLGIDSEVDLAAPSGAVERFRVVGEAMVHDGVEPNVGIGGVLTPDGLARLDPSALESSELAIDLVDGPGRADAVEELREVFPTARVPFPRPASLANANRISGLPLYFALGAAVLAAITLAHALVMTVRRNRRELALYRVVGFTRRQVLGAVVTQATVLGFVAAALGIPLGVIGARWGWRLMARSFGLATSPLVEVGVVVAGAAGAVLVASLVAGPTARLATRLEPGRTLRVE